MISISQPPLCKVGFLITSSIEMAKLTAADEVHNAPARCETDIESSSFEKSSEGEKSRKPGEWPRDPNIVDFNGPDDPENPLNWSTARKTTSIVIVSLTALLT